MEEEKITIGRETFKVLASGTRVDILKSLDKRRKTLSELSRQFGMSVSTVKEHLDTLSKAELVAQADDGHKWKYYDLTKKGQAILHPEGRKVMVMLGVSAIGIGVTLLDLFSGFISRGYGALSSPSVLTQAAEAAKDSGGLRAPPAVPGMEAVTSTVPQVTLPVAHITIIALFAVLLGAAAGYMVLSRRKMLRSSL